MAYAALFPWDLMASGLRHGNIAPPVLRFKYMIVETATTIKHSDIRGTCRRAEVTDIEACSSADPGATFTAMRSHLRRSLFLSSCLSQIRNSRLALIRTSRRGSSLVDLPLDAHSQELQ